jgi:hypothetical protein
LNAFDANPVDTLVIDFRGNTGGDDSPIQALTTGWIARIPAFLSNPTFRVYAVIDKGTLFRRHGRRHALQDAGIRLCCAISGFRSE